MVSGEESSLDRKNTLTKIIWLEFHGGIYASEKTIFGKRIGCFA